MVQQTAISVDLILENNRFMQVTFLNAKADQPSELWVSLSMGNKTKIDYNFDKSYSKNTAYYYLIRYITLFSWSYVFKKSVLK